MIPLQAGALLFLSRYAEAKLTDDATLLGLGHPAVTVLVTALEHNGWMTKRRMVRSTRARCLSLNRWGNVLVLQI